MSGIYCGKRWGTQVCNFFLKIEEEPCGLDCKVLLCEKTKRFVFAMEQSKAGLIKQRKKILHKKNKK